MRERRLSAIGHARAIGRDFVEDLDHITPTDLMHAALAPRRQNVIPKHGHGPAPGVRPGPPLGVLLDVLLGQSLDGVVGLESGAVTRVLFSGSGIAALRDFKHRVGGELARGSERDAGGKGELARATGGVAVAHRKALVTARLYDGAQSASAAVRHLIANGTGLEVLNRDLGERAGHGGLLRGYAGVTGA